MADLNDLKKLFERELKKEEDDYVDNEQKLLKQITIYLCSQKGISPLQGYKPEEIMTFLDKPVAEIKQCIGGDWSAMDDSKFENLIYSLSKKVKKSNNLTNW